MAVQKLDGKSNWFDPATGEVFFDWGDDDSGGAFMVLEPGDYVLRFDAIRDIRGQDSPEGREAKPVFDLVVETTPEGQEDMMGQKVAFWGNTPKDGIRRKWTMEGIWKALGLPYDENAPGQMYCPNIAEYYGALVMATVSKGPNNKGKDANNFVFYPYDQPQETGGENDQGTAGENEPVDQVPPPPPRVVKPPTPPARPTPPVRPTPSARPAASTRGKPPVPPKPRGK